MIGRYDELFFVSNPLELALAVIQLVRGNWPQAIVEDPLTGASLESAILGTAALPEQIFIYRDEAAKHSWELNGAIPANNHTMIHLAVDDHTLAVIVDDPQEAWTKQVLSSVSQKATDLSMLRMEAAA